MGKVTPIFSNVASKINYMYSDGPEDIEGVNVPCTLLAYKENSFNTDSDGTKELLLPELVELEAYHNNCSAGPLVFGFLVHNVTNSSVRVDVKSYDIVTPISGSPEEIMKNKVKNNVKVETVFANYEGFKQNEKISVAANEYALIYTSSVIKAQNSINARMRIRTLVGDGQCFYGRFVCFRPNTDGTLPNAKTLWELTNSKYPAGAEGQFTGIVNYLDKAVDVTVSNEGDYFTLFNTAKYAANGENSTEFEGVIYHKPKGKRIFAGNYGVVYKVMLRHPRKSGYKLEIIPYDADNQDFNFAFSLVKRLDGDDVYEAFNGGIPLTRESNSTSFNGGTRESNSTSWSGSYDVPLSSASYDEFDLILPAANCGVIMCKYVKA